MKWRHRNPPQIQDELFPYGLETDSLPKRTVLSFGAGQDSLALLLLLALDAKFRALFAPQDLIVVFSDTGAEHKETYKEVLPLAIQICRTYHIPFRWLQAGGRFHSQAWPTLLEYYARTQTCGSRGFPRSCTDQLKIRPVYRWLEHHLGKHYQVQIGRKRGLYQFAKKHGRIRMLIGLSAEEGGRCDPSKRPLWMRRTIDIRYPLQEVGATRAHAQEIIREYNYPVPPPSSCRVCPFLTLRDLLWKYRTRRHEYDELLAIETTKRKKWHHLGNKNYGVFGPIPLTEALALAQHQFGHMSDTALTQARLRDGHAVRSRY